MKFTRLLFSYSKKIYCHHDIGIKYMIKLEENIYHKMQWCVIILFLALCIIWLSYFSFSKLFKFFSIILFSTFFLNLHIIYFFTNWL